jgi:hypothetical protein
MRLSDYVWFPMSDCETLSAWINQRPDRVGGFGLLNSGNDCWRFSTKSVSHIAKLVTGSLYFVDGIKHSKKIGRQIFLAGKRVRTCIAGFG